MQELKSKQDVKVFILHLMDNISDPLTLTEINEMAMQDDFIRAIDFAECFSELIDTDNIALIENQDDETRYVITDRGHQVVLALKSTLSGFVRAKSLKSAMRYLSFTKRGAEVESVVTNEGKKSRLSCRIKESGEEIFTLELSLDNEYQLELMRHGFEQDPERIYKAVLAILSGETGYLGI